MQLSFLLYHMKSTSVVFANITLQPSESYHLACIYDGEKLCIHVNNTLASVLYPPSICSFHTAHREATIRTACCSLE